MQIKTLILLTVLFGVFLMVDRSAYAQVSNQPFPGVTVTGEGIVRVMPDMATVRFSIVTRGLDAETARQQNAAASSEAMNAVRALGIPEERIRMETFRIEPIREYNETTRQYVEKGLEVIRDVVVQVYDLELLPTLVAEVVQKGANRLHGVSYDLRDRKTARNEALREAVSNAREKAELMASALGTTLGKVVQVNEQMFDFPQPYFRMASQEMMAKDAAVAPEPDAYASGEIEVRATVQVLFAIL